MIYSDWQISGALSTIAAIENDTTAQAEKIAAAEMYIPEYKREQIALLGATAAQQVLGKAEPVLAALEGEITRLERVLTPQITPSATDAEKLNYTRAALAARWQGMTDEAMITDWRALLESGDLIAVRVYRDFAAPVLLEKSEAISAGRGDGEKQLRLDVAASLDELITATNHALATPEQLRAAPRLDELRQHYQRLQLESGAANMRLSALRYQRGGVAAGNPLATPVAL